MCIFSLTAPDTPKAEALAFNTFKSYEVPLYVITYSFSPIVLKIISNASFSVSFFESGVLSHSS
jgi:hypothetical protein